MCVSIDSDRAEAFSGQMIGMFNQSLLGLMTSIGHRAGLFDTLAGLPPSTSQEIADAAGLDERYVREWLGAMVTGKIIDYDGARRSYALPAEHAAFLTRAAGPDNLAMMHQYIACLASVEDQITECFKNGGGVPYSAYENFQKLQGEESSRIHDAVLIDSTLPTVEGLPERLAAGIDVVDIGCGQGHASNLIAQAYPKSRVRAYDISEEGTAAGRAEAAELGLDNITFDVRDVARLDEVEAFDLITAFDTIHDQVDPAAVLAGVYRALRPGGIFLCVDISASSNLADNVDHPLGPALYACSTMHCMTVSLAHGGAGLGTMWGEELARKMLADAGFDNVTVRRVEGDILNNYYIARK